MALKGWEATRLLLKKTFQAKGITHCELHYQGCWINNALSFAHSMKRRKIHTQEEMEEVVLACIPCHNILENKSAEEMLKEVRRVIKRRDGVEVMFDD